MLDKNFNSEKFYTDTEHIIEKSARKVAVFLNAEITQLYLEYWELHFARNGV